MSNGKNIFHLFLLSFAVLLLNFWGSFQLTRNCFCAILSFYILQRWLSSKNFRNLMMLPSFDFTVSAWKWYAWSSISLSLVSINFFFWGRNKHDSIISCSLKTFGNRYFYQQSAKHLLYLVCTTWNNFLFYIETFACIQGSPLMISPMIHTETFTYLSLKNYGIAF